MANLTEKDIIQAFKNLTEKGKQSVRKSIGIVESITGVEAKPLGGVTDTIKEYNQALASQEKIMRSLGEANRFTAESARLLETESFKLFSQIDQGRQSVEALSSEMKTFAFMNTQTQKILGTTTMVLQQFGVGMEDTAQILDTAAMAFGMSEQELMKLGTGLATVVYRFPGQASEIARNFKQAQSSLAYDSGKIMEVFKKLQYTSSTTGVSFDKLTSAFGDSMDTFEGSASKAGSLNAILGRSVFNSIDLLGKTEAERVDTIVQGVRQSIGGDVNKLGKFQLKAVAEGMGLSVEDTRRLLSGQATPDTIMKDKQDPRTKLQQQAVSATDDNTMSLQELTTEFKTYRSVLANAQIQAQAAAREKMFETAERAINTALGAQNVKILSTADALDKLLVGASTGDIKKAFTSSTTSKEALALRRGLKQGTVSEEELVKNLAGPDFQKAFKDLPEQIKSTFKQQIEKMMPNVKLPSYLQRVVDYVAPDRGKDKDTGKDGIKSDSGYKQIAEAFENIEWSINITGLTGDTLKGMLKTVGTGINP
jgi:hypothetical protein